MYFKKGKKKKDHFSMSTDIFFDNTISLKAKGLLCQMLSFPDDWEYSIAGLIKTNKEGESAIVSAIKELEDAGYLIRAEERDERGRFRYIYSVFDKPQHFEYENPEVVEDEEILPHPDFPGTVNPGAENQGQYYIYNNNIHTINSLDKLNNINTSSKKERKSKTHFDKIIDSHLQDPKVRAAMIEYIKMRKLIKEPLTDYALLKLIENLKKLSSNNTDIMLEILDNSIRNNWKDFYPPKKLSEPPNTKQPGFKNFSQRNTDFSELEKALLT